MNLHRSQDATDVLHRRFIRDQRAFGFIQEPWTRDDLIKGLPSRCGKLIYCSNDGRPRAALLLAKHIQHIPLTEFLCRDLAAAIVYIPTERGTQKIVIASVYFPGDDDEPPPSMVRKLIAFCKRRNYHPLIGGDVNAHHTAWGSSDTRIRGEFLLDYLNLNGLVILNRGNVPTYCHEGQGREEVLDISFASPHLAGRTQNWHVSDEVSSSDHRHIFFDLTVEVAYEEGYRVPRNTDWSIYSETLRVSLEGFNVSIENKSDLDRFAEELSSKIVGAYEAACPLMRRKTKRDVPWWNTRLERLRKRVRRLSTISRRTGDRTAFKAALTDYNKEIRRSKRKSWRSFCGEIADTNTASRIRKIVSKDHSNGVGSLKDQYGHYTESGRDSLELLLSTHFPGCQQVASPASTSPTSAASANRRHRRAFVKSSTIFTKERLRWTIRSQKPFKSAGPDGIFPALLQRGLRWLSHHLMMLFRWSYTLEHVPFNWRQVRVIFIPKTGRRDLEQPKAFRPISLMSVILKSMERLVAAHIRSTALYDHPIHKAQHAYRPGRSTLSALHQVVGGIEGSLRNGEVALAAFADIEGAFDRTDFVCFRRALTDRGIDSSTILWIMCVLKNRRITARLRGEELTVKSIKSCPQGGVLSPLLLSLVIDSLLVELDRESFEVVGYADDIAILVRGKFDSVIFDRMQTALNVMWNWCLRNGLGVNPSKTVLILLVDRAVRTWDSDFTCGREIGPMLVDRAV